MPIGKEGTVIRSKIYIIRIQERRAFSPASPQPAGAPPRMCRAQLFSLLPQPPTMSMATLWLLTAAGLLADILFFLQASCPLQGQGA